ncbi:MAG: carboxypeptidase regulatory-like domain-containing protein [Acidobacteriota bacterium]
MSFREYLCLFLLLTAAWGQEFRSTLSGRVVDAQGAVAPGVKVTATESNTGARHETVSTGEGQYTLTFLPPGAYRISAEAAGFKRYVREGVRISTNERVALDISLEVGQIAETVTVTAEAPMLQTATASTGQVITARQIDNMPLHGRTPLVLAQLAFGVVPTSDPRFYRPFDNSGPSSFSMGGAPARVNELLIDGAPDTTRDNRVAYNPPMDAVMEVKVETFQADAAYGHTGGGTVNVVLKGGTNAVHGAAYEFNQVSRLGATPFFTNRAGLRKMVTRYNQWGVNLGAPLVIPRLLDGRNRVFVYFAYEGIKDSIPRPVTSTAPTAPERNGDFSQLLALGASYQIYDPQTGVREGARVRRQPFARNIIPENRVSPIARNYLEFYPLPNQPGRPDGLDNFLSNTNGEVNGFQSELGRIDFNPSQRHKLFFNYRFNERLGDGGNNLGKSITDVTATNGVRRSNYGSMLDDVFTFTPTTVLNTRLNWTRYTEASRLFSEGFDMTKLGFPASLAAASPQAILPTISFDRFTSLGDSAGSNTPFDIFQVFSTLTKIAGQHSLKAGADLRLSRESSIGFGYSSGQYSFGSAWARGPLDNSPAAPIGQDLAAFLLGRPTGGGFDINAGRTNQAGYYSLFLQDDWRASAALTLNLGVRYERDLPTVERFNRAVNGFDYATPNPISAQAQAAYARSPIPEVPVGQFRTPGGLLFPGPGNRSLYRTKSRYFSPRVGLAWSPAALGGKTSIRGGGGVFFFPLGTTGVNQLGFSHSTSLVASLDGYLTPAATFGNPFPNGIEQPPGASQGLATYLGRSFSFFNPDPLNGYSLRWHASVQRELSPHLLVELGYMGNRAVHLDVNRQLNFVPRRQLSTRPTRDQATIDRLTAQVTNPFAGLLPGTGLNSAVVQRQQLLRPYPQYTGVTAQSLADGSSYFHMLQVRADRRFALGLQFLANYQWSKLLERRSRLNDSDPSLEKRIAGEDRPQRLVLSGSYELPFGRGKAVDPANRLLRGLVSGWVVNAIYTMQSGPALGWGNLIYYGGDLRLDPRAVDRAFDVTRFETNSRQQLDWNVRTFPSRFGNLRADGVDNIDLSLIKNITVTERVSLQYRAEAFNAFNRVQFNPPSLAATSTGFGTITQQSNLPRRIQMALRMVW